MNMLNLMRINSDQHQRKVKGFSPSILIFSIHQAFYGSKLNLNVSRSKRKSLISPIEVQELNCTFYGIERHLTSTPLDQIPQPSLQCTKLRLKKKKKEVYAGLQKTYSYMNREKSESSSCIVIQTELRKFGTARKISYTMNIPGRQPVISTCFISSPSSLFQRISEIHYQSKHLKMLDLSIISNSSYLFHFML